jgi:hypothetical protein
MVKGDIKRSNIDEYVKVVQDMFPAPLLLYKDSFALT